MCFPRLLSALCLLASAMSAPAFAAGVVTPAPQPLPAPLLVTVTFVEASASDINQAEAASGTGVDAPAQILALLQKRKTIINTFPIVTYMADVEASNERTQIVPFQTRMNGKPQGSVLSLVTGAAIVPHREADGFLLLNISATSSRLGSTASAADAGAPPSTITISVHTKLHFRNGETKMFGGLAVLPSGTTPSPPETLVFVTVDAPSSCAGSPL